MFSNQLRVGCVYTLPVDKSVKNDLYFVVKTDEGNTFKINKLKFQRIEEMPDELPCMVKSVRGDVPVLAQNLTPIISRFYRQGARYLFRVKADYTRNHFYEVEDGYGLYFRLYDTTAKLQKGQEICCNITKLQGPMVVLQLVTTGGKRSRLPYLTYENVLNRTHCTKQTKVQWKRFVLSDAMEQVREEYAMGSAEWIFSAMDVIIEEIPHWYQGGLDGRLTTADEMVLSLKEMLIDLLERSMYLAGCNSDDRKSYRNIFSDYLERVNYFLKASNMVRNDSYKEFSNEVFTNLKSSGYLYHPDKRFHILNTLLSLHPELIHEWMGKIFDAITSWDISTWKDEPFRSAFVKEIELYVRNNQKMVDEIPSVNSEGDKEALSKIITAIAIQVLLADERVDGIDMLRNRAMMYRYLSLINNLDKGVLLDKALLCMIGGELKPEFGWKQIQQTTMLGTLAAIAPTRQPDLDLLKSYTSGYNYFEISSDGITLTHNSSGGDEQAVIPNNVKLWRNLQVFVENDEEVHLPSAAKKSDLGAYDKMWNDIYNIFFPPVVVQPKKKVKLRPDVGDEVQLYVDDIEYSGDKGVWLHCVVFDNTYEGEGWMNLKDVVRYDTPVTMADFFDDETKGRLVFDAEVNGVDAQGELSFKMLSQIDDYITSTVGYNDECLCVIVSRINNNCKCISEYGYSVNVVCDEEHDYGTTNYINVRIEETLRANSIKGEIMGLASYDQIKDLSWTPFHNILQSCCSGIIEPDSTENRDEVLQANEILSLDQMNELISIIRRQAYLAPDDVLTFNYLGYARLLARLIENTFVEQVCAAHMKMLLMMRYYVKNNRVEVEKLEEVREFAKQAPILKRLYDRLFILSQKDNVEGNHALWELMNEMTNEENIRLAQLVFSINMTKQFDNSETEIHKILAGRITEMMKININNDKRKFYGSENQFTEFKTSIVYPSDKSHHMHADLLAQSTRIAQVVCGFLNAEGGVLYLGVNDLGYECGLHGDFAFLKLDSLDKYIVTVGNLLNAYLGTLAMANVRMEAEQNTKDPVVAINIAPSLQVVSMKADGAVFVRQTTSTRRLTPAEVEIFREERGIRYRRLLQTQQAEEENVVVVTEEVKEEVKKEEVTTIKEQPKQVEKETIATSGWRHNVVHQWDDADHFVEPEGYLYFLKGGKYIYSTEDKWLEEDKDTLCTLVMTDTASEDYLVLVYENGCINKVAMRELKDKKGGESYKHWSADKLIFAAPCRATDSLLLVVGDAKHNVYQRLQPIEKLKAGSMNAQGASMIDLTYGGVYEVEVVDTNRMPDFAKVSKACSNKAYGYPLNVNMATDAEGAQAAISELMKRVRRKI